MEDVVSLPRIFYLRLYFRFPQRERIFHDFFTSLLPTNNNAAILKSWPFFFFFFSLPTVPEHFTFQHRNWLSAEETFRRRRTLAKSTTPSLLLSCRATKDYWKTVVPCARNIFLGRKKVFPEMFVFSLTLTFSLYNIIILWRQGENLIASCYFLAQNFRVNEEEETVIQQLRFEKWMERQKMFR